MSFLPTVRQAMRGLRRSGWFSSAAVLTLGLGMGAAVTLFGVLHAALLREPPFPAASRLFVVKVHDENRQGAEVGVRQTPTMTLLQRLEAVETFGCAAPFGQTSWQGPDGPISTGIYKADPGFLGVTGWRPFLGRAFEASDREGWILSHRFWRSHLKADPSWIGRPLTLGTQTWPVLGISRPGFELPVAGGSTVDVLEPLAPTTGSGRIFALLRLQAGVDPSPIAGALAETYRANDPKTSPRVRLLPLKEVLQGRMDRANTLVFAAAGLMLALAAASVAGLFLARAAERAWEVSLRRTLGSPERAIFGRFLTEGLLVAMAASVLALGAAALLSGHLRAWLPGGPALFGVETAWAHWGVVAYTLATGCLLSLVLALVPMFHLRRVAPARTLAEGRNSRGQGALIVVQVAVATLLLAAASLLGRSLLGILREDLGFRTADIVRIDIEERDYRVQPDPEASTTEAVAAMQRALAALRARPGIEAAALGDLSFRLEGESLASAPWNQLGAVASVSAGEGFAELMGLRLLEGRTFTPADLLGGRRVCLLDAPTAQSLFPAGALGQRVPGFNLIRFQLNTRGFGRDMLPSEPLEVIGVVAPIRPMGRLQPTAPAVLWVPSSLSYMPSLYLRSRLPARELRALVDAVFQEHLPTLGVGAAVPLDEARWKLLLPQRQTLGLVSLFGGLSLVLTCLALGGLMWGVAVRRTREIGLRMALGATPMRVARWLLQKGLTWVSLGAALGLGAALVFGRVMASLLHGTAPSDPLALALAILTLTTACLLACLIPALRAAGMAPAEALRSE